MDQAMPKARRSKIYDDEQKECRIASEEEWSCISTEDQLLPVQESQNATSRPAPADETAMPEPPIQMPHDNMNKNSYTPMKHDLSVEPLSQYSPVRVKCVEGTRLANLTDCMSYYMCNATTGAIYRYKCPMNTGFDAERRVCDRQVPCLAAINPTLIQEVTELVRDRLDNSEALQQQLDYLMEHFHMHTITNAKLFVDTILEHLKKRFASNNQAHQVQTPFLRQQLRNQHRNAFIMRRQEPSLQMQNQHVHKRVIPPYMSEPRYPDIGRMRMSPTAPPPRHSNGQIPMPFMRQYSNDD